MNTEFVSFQSPKNDETFTGEGGEDTALLTDTIAPWLQPSLTRGAPPLVRLHNEIQYFCKHTRPDACELRTRENLVEELSSIITELWPNADVYVFGSMMTKILTPTSDIDMCVLDIPEASKTDPIQLMLSLANLITSKNICTYIEVIEGAKVPIIKLDHRESGISVDICINERSGLLTGKLVKEMVILYPPMLPLTIVLKHFLAQRRLNEPYMGGCGSFMLSLMVLSFLQHRHRIEKFFDLTLSWNLGSLLMDFLCLYGGGSFDYTSVGISVTDSGKYFKRSGRSDWQHCRLGRKNPNLMLGLENPHQPDIDIGKGSFMMPKIRRSLEHARQLLGFALSDGTATSYLRYVIRTDDPRLQRQTSMVKIATRWRANPTQQKSSCKKHVEKQPKAHNSDSNESISVGDANQLHSFLNDDVVGYADDDEFGASAKGKKRPRHEHSSQSHLKYAITR